MKRFAVEVVEVRHVRRRYVVEAETPEKVVELAEGGVAEEEFHVRDEGVDRRVVNPTSVRELPF